MSVRLTLTVLLLTVAAPGLLYAAGPEAGVDYEFNLSQVPAADPAPTNAPKLLPTMRGVHPRLLFTEAEIAKLKPLAEKDPLFNERVKEMITWAKRMKTLQGTPPALTRSDTPALVTGFERLPQMAWAYGLTGDPVIRDNIIAILKIMLDQPHWAHTQELDSSMGAGNNMAMVGFLFDAVCNDLDPEFRTAMAQKMLTHVRRMYYLGHEQKSQCRIKYWQQDPANNHRWHRMCGVAACLLAIADVPGLKADDVGYMLQQYRKEMDFLLKWYPHDGDCHEGSGYQRFGFFYLALAAEMWDRVMGTTCLQHPGFANAWAQQLYYWAPGRNGFMTFGDAPNSNGSMNNLGMAFLLSPRITQDRNVQAAVLRFYRKTAMFKRGDKEELRFGWALLKCYDPTLTGGDYAAIPTYRLFADLGAATMRDNWEDDAVLFTFKCGPYGGYRLNAYRHAHLKDGKPHYVNIAHDDPDANSFALGARGEFFFHPGNYATRKMTDLHNTVTVAGKGQLQEGETYTQPTPELDMRTLSYLTGWKVDKPSGRIIVEGEAGPAYKVREKDEEGQPTGEISPRLERFRRTCIWLPGEYVLVLDDIRAAAGQKHAITWLAGTPFAQFETPGEGRCYVEAENGQRMDFQILANKEFNGSIDYMHMAGRWTGLLLNQFQFSRETDAIKYACLMDPWKRDPAMALKEEGDVVTLTVKGQGINDTWTWTPARDLQAPSIISGTRDGKPLAALTEEDRAPHGD